MQENTIMNAIASAACPPLAAQTVLVTGGSRGLGRAISEAFLAQGARVLINCLHSPGALQQNFDYKDTGLTLTEIGRAHV